MALIKQAEAGHLAKNAVALHLGDLSREGAGIVARAREEAASILAAANAERGRLLADGAERGHAEGFARGLAEGRAKGHEDGRSSALAEGSAELAALLEAWGQALARFEGERERMIAEAKADIVRLAAVFAERVTKRVVELDPGVVADQMEAALRAAVRPTRAVFSVHPEDESQARRALPGLLARVGSTEHAELLADASVGRGSCVLSLPGGGVIDASLSTQIDRLVEALVPGRGGGGEGP